MYVLILLIFIASIIITLAIIIPEDTRERKSPFSALARKVFNDPISKKELFKVLTEKYKEPTENMYKKAKKDKEKV